MDDLEMIYREYYPIVYRYLLKLCMDPELAEELCQETMFQSIQKIHTFKGESKLSTWLCTIAKNLYYSEYKKRQRVTLDYPLDTIPSELDLEEKLRKKETAREIHIILHELDEPYKEVFWLRTFADLSFREIGGLFQKTENWARVTYYRAKNKIKEALE